MTPSFTDQRFSCPSQPSRSLPLKSWMVSDLPSFLTFSSAATGAATARHRQTLIATTGRGFMVSFSKVSPEGYFDRQPLTACNAAEPERYHLARLESSSRSKAGYGSV